MEEEATAAKEKEPKEQFQFSKIWSTRDIQQVTSFNREAYLRTWLFEFIIFLFFVVVVCIVLSVLRSLELFFFCHAILNTFVKAPISDAAYHLTFETIATREEFFEYMQDALINGLYSARNETDEWVMFQNVVIKSPQLRQIRVRNDTCPIPRNIQSKITVCYGPYASDNLSKDNLRGVYGTKFSTKSKVSSVDYSGTLSTYGAHGYIVRLSRDKGEAQIMLNSLRFHEWIDRGTRVVFILFFLYNPSTNVIACVTLAGEFSMTGGVFTSHQIRTVRFLNYNLSESSFTIVFIFALFISYYCLEEVLEILILRGAYFELFTSYVDFGIIMFGINIILIALYCGAQSTALQEDIWDNVNYPSNLIFMSYIQFLLDFALASLVFLTFIKLFKYLSITKTLTKLSHTIYESTRDLLGYSILFFFVIISFGLLGMLLFGYQVSIFSTLGYSVVALFRMLLGDIDFEYIDDKHSVIGAAYLIIYVVTIYFILMNVFLAIIFESYSKVKDWTEKKTFEIYLIDYIKMKFSKKILSTKKIKCSTWVEEMLKQGYPDKAVEQVLEKHERQGVVPDTWLNRHQILTLTFELEDCVVQHYNYEKIGALERHFDDLQEKMDDGLNQLSAKHLEHKKAMAKLLKAVDESDLTGDEKAAAMQKLIQNEIGNS